MWALASITLAAVSIGLAAFASPNTLGSAFPGLVVAVALLALCWRIFERVLWLRFPTAKEHTVAWRFGTLALLPLVALHAVLVALGL